MDVTIVEIQVNEKLSSDRELPRERRIEPARR